MTAPAKILVADDDARDLQMTLLALARHGHKDDVVVTVDGAEALDYLLCRGRYQARQRGNPAFVLLDFKMPRMNGVEVLRHIRTVPQLALMPVIMFTSSRERADVVECYQCGANSYVVKPMDFHQFVATVGEVASYWLKFNEPPPVQPLTTEDGEPAVLPMPKLRSELLPV